MHLRVTKYPPAHRDPQGRYLRNEWTSIADLGKVFADGVFALADYLAVEQAYVDVVKSILARLRVVELEITELENYGEPPSPLHIQGITTSVQAIDDGIKVSGQVLEDVMRLCLREVIWCKLQGEGGFYVHFGYDYYMYVGYGGEMSLDGISAVGIYIEERESPYLEGGVEGSVNCDPQS